MWNSQNSLILTLPNLKTRFFLSRSSFTVRQAEHTSTLVVWLWCQQQPPTREDTLGQSHPSTPAQRLQSARYLVAHAGEYGVVTALSRTLGVSRPTLYAWRAQAQQALQQVFAPTPIYINLTAHHLTRGVIDRYWAVFCAD